MSDTYESPCLLCDLTLTVVKRNGCDNARCPRDLVVDDNPDSLENQEFFKRHFTHEGHVISYSDTQPIPFSEPLQTDPATLLTSLGGLENVTSNE